MEMKSIVRKMARSVGIILIVFLITMGVTAYLAQIKTPVYEARTTLITKASDQVTEARTLSSALSVLSRGNAVVPTYTEVAKSNNIKSKAATRLGLSGGDLRGFSVSSRVIADTNIIQIIVEGPDPALVRDFANAIGDETIAFAQSDISAYKLELLDSATLPAKPTGLSYYESLALGAVLGLFFGIGAALLSIWISDIFREDPATQANNVQQELNLLKSEFSTLRSELVETKAILKNAESDAMNIASSLHVLASQQNGK